MHLRPLRWRSITRPTRRTTSISISRPRVFAAVAAGRPQSEPAKRAQRHRHRDPAGRLAAAGIYQSLQSVRSGAEQRARRSSTARMAPARRQGAFQLMTDFLNLLLDPTAGGGGGGGGERSAAIRAGRPAEPAAGDRAGLRACAAQTPAPRRQPPDFDQRWSAWGSALRRLQHHQRQCHGRLEQFYRERLWLCRRHDLSRRRRRPVTALRSPAAAPIGIWRKRSAAGAAMLPGRRLWHDAFRAGLSVRRARFRQSLVHHQPHRASAISSPRSSKARATRRAAKPAIATACRSRAYIIGVTPYAALQVQDFHTPGYSETDLTGGGFGLTYNAMNATDTRERTRCALRQSDHLERHAAGSARPARLGA